MEVNTTSFNPTPNLKSSPIPILFVPFTQCIQNCFNCGDKYSRWWGNNDYNIYCKKCLLRYINESDNDKYLDVILTTCHSQCGNIPINKMCLTNSIQEWCGNCSKICFNQLSYCFKCQLFCLSSMCGCHLTNCPKCPFSQLNNRTFLRSCNTCEKGVGTGWCQNCYIISSEQVKSSLNDKPISILYLPWWDASGQCIICRRYLIMISTFPNCQKYCRYCIVVYTGCRYCLTTNIIFGFVNKSKCKKCSKVQNITLDHISSGNNDLDEFLNNLRLNFHNNIQIAEIINDLKELNNLEIHPFIRKKYHSQAEEMIKWIPYSHFKDVIEIAKGGYGVIYRAKWVDAWNSFIDGYDVSPEVMNGDVALKRLEDPQNFSKHFLKEVTIVDVFTS